MRNFDYLQELGLTDLHRFCSAAEELQLSNPDLSAISARKALEYVVRSLYVMKHIEIPERASLFELVDGEPFQSFINDDRVMMAVHYVRKVGNNGAHGTPVSKRESFFCLLNIYNVVAAILLKLTVVSEVKPFDRDLIPRQPEQPTLAPTNVSVSPTSAIVEASNPESVADKTPVQPLPTDISEAETRKLFIDLMLKEAGWDVLDTEGTVQPSKACIEVEVKGMPNNEGVGYCDYVLFAANGLPLAVVEAKRTSADAVKGKHQAELYADCLEQQYGQRPVIYYSNGFETFIIDGLGYPPRKLYGFHTEQDLEWMIQQRKRHDIADFSVNDSITDRAYQKMAIKAVCEHFNSKHRKGLLVMATGTGKTRVAISMVDVLTRNEWVKNVLFLADRIPLVSQAHKNFVKLLPNMTTSVLSEERDPDTTARITFSTYQTMINYIDRDEKAFSVGRFDLIIVDEAHRSIFGKYASILKYFDALVVGLTATPRDEVDRSTYETFEMEQGEPNFAYELEDAVAEGYLVNYRGFKRGSLILREGIKYDSLSDEEKEQLEGVWAFEKAKKGISPDTGTFVTHVEETGTMAAEPPAPYGTKGNGYHRDIQQREIFSYIYNQNTIDHVLQDLMENGLKVQHGERVGKTIIFAYNHQHAEMIVQRFNDLYPEYGPEFCVLIDNYVTYAKDLIEKLEVRDGNPQIAVSVDMLDTGVDVPDVLNLVFFKPIKSKIKFMQMIGRGTRLSADIFGEGKDKECFYIFDWCRNFEYFDKHPDGQKGLTLQSLTEKIFCLRTRVAFHLQHQQYQEDPPSKALHDELKDILHEQVASLSDSHISVREKWSEVCRFKSDEAWKYISEVDVNTLITDLSPLLPKPQGDESAKKFDILALTVQLSLLDEETKGNKAAQAIQSIAEKLQDLASHPSVQARMGTIKEVCSKVAWENVSVGWLEKVRTELRDLLKFLASIPNRRFVVDIEDITTDDGTVEGITPRVTYKQSVLDFLTQNRDLLVLKKIYNIEQLTGADFAELERILWKELGSREDYDRYTKGMVCGENVAIFLRSVMGIDRKEAVRRFSDFISGSELNAEQEDFLNTIISYVCENGDITKEVVVNDAPFDERLNVFTPFMLPLAKYVDNLHEVVMPDVG